MSAPTEVRDQARALRLQGKTYREIGERLGFSESTAARWAPNPLSAPDRLGPNGSAQDASGLVPGGRCRRARKKKPAPVIELLPLPDGTTHGWTRAYEAARALGFDMLELKDACWECPGCSRLPLEGCVCVPVREEKAA